MVEFHHVSLLGGWYIFWGQKVGFVAFCSLEAREWLMEKRDLPFGSIWMMRCYLSHIIWKSPLIEVQNIRINIGKNLHFPQRNICAINRWISIAHISRCHIYSVHDPMGKWFEPSKTMSLFLWGKHVVMLRCWSLPGSSRSTKEWRLPP